MTVITANHFVKSRTKALRLGCSSLALAAIAGAFPSLAQAQDDTAAANVSTTQDIVVTGRRAALEKGDERKRLSETIVDSIVADDAGKLPDNSITEVLQRVPGVTIVRFAALNDPDHFSVQGSGIQVRGLSGVASRLNGREIFSANNGRSLSFSDVTPELMRAVDVYKASTADLIEGGTGGQVNLTTKLPFDNPGFHVAGTGELGVGDLAHKTDPSGSFLVSDTFDTGIGRIGILADIAYSQFSSLSQFFRAEPYFRQNVGGKDYFIPGGYMFGEEEFQRRRYGYYGAVQWQPSDALTLTATYFQSRYKNRSGDWASFVQSQNVVVDPALSEFDSNGGLISTTGAYVRDPATFAPAATFQNGGNKGKVKSDDKTQDYSLAFQWAPAGSPLSVSGSLQRVDSTRVYDRLDVFRVINIPGNFGLDLSGKLPSATMPQETLDAYSDPANYLWQATMPHNERNKGRLDAAQLDAEYSFDDGFFKSVKVGGRYSERKERDFENGYNWAALGQGWNGPQLTFADALPGDVEGHAFGNFFHGAVNVPTNLLYPSKELVENSTQTSLGQDYPNGYGGAAMTPAPSRTDYSTKTLAGYALARFGSSDGIGLSGNVGVRVVHLKNRSSGVVRQLGAQFARNGQIYTLADTSVAREGGASFTYALPSINLDYALSPEMKVRFGYNITLDNQSFNALRAAGSVGVVTATNPDGSSIGSFTNYTTTSGDPALRPTISNNFDLSFEYYGSAGKSFHIAPFYKRLTNMPIFSLIDRPITVTFADGTTEQGVAATSDFRNSKKAATILGVEVGGRFFFDMLPGWLSGLGVEANYTFIHSKNPGDFYRDIDGNIGSDVPVVGLSKHNANATLLYEKDPFSVRIAYSWRSKYLQSTNSNGTNPGYSYYSAPGVSRAYQIALPMYGDAYGTLDAGIRFKVTDNFSWGIQGTNLLNSTQKTLMGGYPDGKLYRRSWFQSDRRLSLGASVAF